MIPLKIQLRNFLSYGPDTQTINFSPHRLICLSGKNGHGKSALLDAITWAIWGQARKVSGATKPDQGLLRLGQTHMMVSLDFAFNNQTYRVRRELTVPAPNKGYLTLDFGFLDTENNSIKPLTKKTTRATQEHIEQILNLDFESFSNSAFLRQGHANEFSKKSPKDRKEILATILGLTKYETIRKLALEKIRQATTEKTTLCALQEKRKCELEKSSVIQKEHALVTNELDQHTKEEQEFQKQIAQLEKQKKALAEQHKQHNLLNYQHEQLIKKENDEQKSVRTLLADWRATQKKARNLLNQELLEKEKKQLEKQLQEQQQALQKLLTVKQEYLNKKEQLHSLEQQIKEQQTAVYNNKKLQIEQLRLEHKNIQEQQRVAQKEHDELTQEKELLTKEFKNLDEKLGLQKKSLEAEKTDEQQFEKRKEHYQKYIAHGNLLKAEQASLRQKKELSSNEDNPSCPLCEQNLSAARKRFLKQKFDQQERFLHQRLTRISLLITQLKAVLIEQHEKIHETKKATEQYATDKAKQKELAKNIDKINITSEKLNNQIKDIKTKDLELGKKLNQSQKALDELEKQDKLALSKNKTYIEIQSSLTTLEKQLAETAYNQKSYAHITQQLNTIEQQLADYATVREQLAQQEQRKKELRSSCLILKKLKKEKAKLKENLKIFNGIADQESKIATQEKEIRTNITSGAQHKELLLQKKGNLEAQQSALEQLKKEQKEQQKQLALVDDTIWDYQAIAQATSKDGIQALLIEEAIPEIEQEANDILSRLTNNQSQIMIESLRDLKKGGTKETLDIKISDPVGVRAYELFSGGEAFRIDFALRIAISKLLARRAGTSLQTLIIDEGFGSQDEEGLANIMNALYAIQDDFSKIIIVSHLSSMKDQFPVHLIIEKGPSGSKVSVVQQG